MTGAPDPAAAGATDRELEVLSLLGEQRTHEEIAARLYISVRTVESHAKSLRHKLNLENRQQLLRYAARYRASHEETRRLRPARLPEPLTSFVGRSTERTELAEALQDARLVTAVGPAGVGKTRLALAVARDVGSRYSDGACHVDLATTTDPDRVPRAVATALGVRGVAGESIIETVCAAIADRELLLLIDNAEHVADAVAATFEQLLARCARFDVLATSRVRLVVPFESVYHVPGLGLPDDAEAGTGDAVRLFADRAVAAGWPDPDRPDLRRVGTICAALDRMALSIELAAARTPALGLDGVERALAGQMELLRGGSRMQPRHQSLERAIGWSYRLLDVTEQSVLQRVAVFVSPFTAVAAEAVAAYGDVAADVVPDALGRLVDHSLLATVSLPAGGTTRYRALESIRQYAASRRDGAGDVEVARRHRRWCRDEVRKLIDEDRATTSRDAAADRRWCDAVDALADEARAALGGSTVGAMPSPGASDLAGELAALLFRRGRLVEAQQRYEEAAELAEDPMAAAQLCASAASTAACGTVGEEMLRLWHRAADAAQHAGNLGERAVALARGAEAVRRWRGMFAQLPEERIARDLLDEARQLAGSDERAAAAVAVAELFSDYDDPAIPERVEQVIERSAAVGDPMVESAARDARTGFELSHGSVAVADAQSRRRLELLSAIELTPSAAIELKDATHVAVFTAIGVGDLRAAREAALRQEGLPFLREEAHMADEEMLTPAALIGDFSTAVRIGERFRASWERAGRPSAPGRGMSPSAMVMVHRLRGDDDAHRAWLDVVADIRGVEPTAAMRGSSYGEVFEAIALLHHGETEAARHILAAVPNPLARLHTPIFRSWRRALLAEAAVLGGDADGEELLSGAWSAADGNPVALAIWARAQALRSGDTEAMEDAAHRFHAAGCRYQWARTLALIGGERGHRGAAELAALGTTPVTTR